ncbi:MAG: glycosyltransferase family 39 protein, partial [Nitrospinota bacterium]
MILKKSSTLAPVFIIVFTLALNVAFVFEQEAKPTTGFFRHNAAFDSSRFLNEAKIIEEDGFYASSGKRRLPPAYPLLIAAFNYIFGSNGSAPLIFQAMLNTGSLALIYFISSVLFGRVPALIAIAVSALYGPFVFYGGMYLRASLVTFESLAVVALLLAGRKKAFWNVLAGIMTALLTLTRPYPLIVLAAHGWLVHKLVQNRNKREAYKIFSFVAAFVIVILIFSPTQRFKADSPQRAPESNYTNAIAHFLSGNVLDSNYGYTWGDTPIKVKLLEKSGGSLTKGALLIFSEIFKNPWDYAKFYYKKIKIFVGGFEPPSNYNFYLFKDELSLVLWAPFISLGWIVPFTLLGLWEGRSQSRNISILYIWISALALSIFIFPIQSRYRLP